MIHQLKAIYTGTGEDHGNKFNARLIATAPDLLEALQMLVELEPNADAEICSYERGCWKHAREAIAKATGKVAE